MSGHFANWELIALTAYRGIHGAGSTGRPTTPSSMPGSSGSGSRYAYPSRSQLDGQGARDMLRTLKSGSTIAMLTDQKHPRSIAYPFFGRDAMTVTGPAVLSSLRTGQR